MFVTLRENTGLLQINILHLGKNFTRILHFMVLAIILVLVDDGRIGQLLAHVPSLPAMCLLSLSVFVEHQAPFSSHAHSSYEAFL